MSDAGDHAIPRRVRLVPDTRRSAGTAARPDVLIEIDRRSVHRGHAGRTGRRRRRRRRDPAARPDPARPRQRALARVPPGAARAYARRQGQLLDLAGRMYALADRLDPDTYYSLARAVYAEMALAGITAVGEFHYLHHGPDGTPLRRPERDGPRAAARGPRRRHPDHAARHALPDVHRGRSARSPGRSCASATATPTPGRTRVAALAPHAARADRRRGALGAGGAGRRRCRRSPRSPAAGRCTSTSPSSGPRTRPASPHYGRTPTQLLGDHGLLGAERRPPCTPPT